MQRCIYKQDEHPSSVPKRMHSQYERKECKIPLQHPQNPMECPVQPITVVEISRITIRTPLPPPLPRTIALIPRQPRRSLRAVLAIGQVSTESRSLTPRFRRPLRVCSGGRFAARRSLLWLRSRRGEIHARDAVGGEDGAGVAETVGVVGGVGVGARAGWGWLSG